jgi:hypothetical protein
VEVIDMSGIAFLDTVSEYATERYDDRHDKSAETGREPVSTMPDEQVLAPSIQAAAAQQDQKTTIQGFQYTGKGAFIDTVF